MRSRRIVALLLALAMLGSIGSPVARAGEHDACDRHGPEGDADHTVTPAPGGGTVITDTSGPECPHCPEGFCPAAASCGGWADRRTAGPTDRASEEVIAGHRPTSMRPPPSRDRIPPTPPPLA